MISRREFLAFAAATTVRLNGTTVRQPARRSSAHNDRSAGGKADTTPSLDQRAGRPLGSEFVFARLRYESGDWDYNPKVAANILDSIIEYTSIPVYKEEVVISASSEELLSFPFVFMTGHKLVRFSGA